MSGVVYALFGYVWMKGRFEPHLQMGVMPQTVTIMLVWLVACMTGLLGPIANAAHVAGLAAGLVAGYAPTGWRRLRRIMRS
jgi:GlpG protein